MLRPEPSTWAVVGEDAEGCGYNDTAAYRSQWGPFLAHSIMERLRATGGVSSGGAVIYWPALTCAGVVDSV